jgi:hypothetical protein
MFFLKFLSKHRRLAIKTCLPQVQENQSDEQWTTDLASIPRDFVKHTHLQFSWEVHMLRRRRDREICTYLWFCVFLKTVFDVDESPEDMKFHQYLLVL